jgi:hypothetical protein
MIGQPAGVPYDVRTGRDGVADGGQDALSIIPWRPLPVTVFLLIVRFLLWVWGSTP